jgi:hypothetical protein
VGMLGLTVLLGGLHGPRAALAGLVALAIPLLGRGVAGNLGGCGGGGEAAVVVTAIQ